MPSFNHSARSFLPIMMFAILLGILLPHVTQAQSRDFGFSMFNERNHPQLEWISAETEHFIITYPAHLSGIEEEAAAIAEATYEALSQNMGVTFDYKIRIFLSDEDEIVNGFAVPFRNSYTNIWVNLNEVAQAWSGPEKWLRTVLAHELAHIFHFEAVKSNLGFLGILGTAPALPDPWTEGIAQYQTEPWHVLRGDALLRTSVYDGRPSFRDGTSAANRGLMYAAGNAQLRYFASAYGDSLLPQILAHRDTTFFGLIRTHSFSNAFREVTGKSFQSFEDEWRRHVSIYYHTLAGQMERSDSLGVKPDTLQGLFIRDVQYSPDGSKKAVVSLRSEAQPILELSVITKEPKKSRRVIYRGNINSPVSWSPDGSTLAFSALTRGENGSILNDIYTINAETGRRTRITHSARASNPQFSGDGDGLYFIVSQQGTSNIFHQNVTSGERSQLTDYSGDVQIGRLALHPQGQHLAYALFDADGNRFIVVRELKSGTEMLFTSAEIDDRNPVWSPDGSMLAYTSMRDRVPNLFVIHPFDKSTNEERVTALFTGASATQWTAPDSLNPAGRLTILTTDSKLFNRVYQIDASRRVAEPEVVVNPAYKMWLTHQPPHAIPGRIEPNPALILDRRPYSSWKNISHVTTIPIPFYANEENFGFGILGIWSEPLSKHMITALGAVNFMNPVDDSFLFLSYINNQLRPSLNFSFYHNSITGRLYDREFLTTTNSGGFLLATLPRDWIDSPFVNTSLYARLRYDYTDANRFWNRPAPITGLPEDGWQSDVRLGFRINKSLPYIHNIIHPLEGYGLEARVTIATPALGGETEYVRPDLRSYLILPGGGMNRFYLYGRAIAQWGDSFAQDYVGFSRFDDPDFGDPIPGLDVLYADAERVRGYSSLVSGNRMLFGTIEYRMPLFDSLNTQILGIIGFGKTTLSAFLDAGVLWNDDLTPSSNAIKRAGTGLEIKNTLNIGFLEISHSVGFAQPVPDFATSKNQEIYYRVRAVIPF